jgi:thioesterase domain-containing protein
VHAAELERFIHEHIPLTRAMGVTVVSVGQDALLLGAPLAPNINHRETVFGGSASALAMLAGWGLLHVRLQDAGMSARLVIQRNHMEYERPIAGDFTARASLGEAGAWPKFRAALERRGKARVTVAALVSCADGIAGRFSGEFVAVAPQLGHLTHPPT